ncbi:MAG: hypothetical protein D3923_12125 [Candidatus Electrothrix sp. AR3]|nr:hypothetical protein [Candidatus Electrothrix sp. AR3]
MILNAIQPFRHFKLEYLRLGKRKIPEHVVIKSKSKKAAVAFLHVDAFSFAHRIKNFNQLVINHKNIKFGLFRDVREPPIKSKVAAEEIEKLNSTENGQYVRMDSQSRIYFELIFQVISDIQNRDFHAEVDQVLPVLEEIIGQDFWLFRALGNAQIKK